MGDATTEETIKAVNGSSAGPKRASRPNRDELNTKIQALESDIEAKNKIHKQVSDSIAKLQGKGDNSTRQKLIEEIQGVRQKFNAVKAARDRNRDEVRSIEEQIRRKIKDLQSARGKSSYKSLEEINKEIERLEQAVGSGSLKLVEEKRYLADISALKRTRTNFSKLEDIQKGIDADKAKAAEVRSAYDDSEFKTLKTKIDELQAKFEEEKAQNQELNKGKSSLFDKRTQVLTEIKALRAEIKKIRTEFQAKTAAFFDQQKAEQAARVAKEQTEREEKKKLQEREKLEAKLEAASEPAFAQQRAMADNLLKFFSRTYGDVYSTADTKDEKSDPDTIEGLPSGATVIKKPDFSTPNEKSKKKNKAKKSKDDKLTLDISVIDNLSALNVVIPTSRSQISKTVEAIQEKVKYYDENEEKITAERIEQAKADLEKLNLKEAAAEDTEKSAESAATEAEAKEEAKEEPEAKSEAKEEETKEETSVQE